MKVEYLDFDQQNSIAMEQIEEIAIVDMEREKSAVILILDDGQKLLITTSEWATIFKYKG